MARADVCPPHPTSLCGTCHVHWKWLETCGSLGGSSCLASSISPAFSHLLTSLWSSISPPRWFLGGLELPCLVRLAREMTMQVHLPPSPAISRHLLNSPAFSHLSRASGSHGKYDYADPRPGGSRPDASGACTLARSTQIYPDLPRLHDLRSPSLSVPDAPAIRGH